MPTTIQWSNNANLANGLGRQATESGKQLPSHSGYIDQALSISNNPTGFLKQDQEKTLRVLASTPFSGHSDRIREAILVAEQRK